MQYVFVHGLGQNALSWRETLAHMGEPADVYIPDLFSMPEKGYATYRNLYLAFSRYLDEIPGPVTLVGLSLGAILSLNYAIEHPGKVQALVLIGAQYKMPKMLLSLQNAVYRFMPESPFLKLGSSKKEFILLTASMKELDFSRELKGLQCDTLIWYGDKDKANKRAAKNLALYIPKAEMQIVPGAGHEVNKEAPGQLALILHDYLKRCR